MSNEVRVLRTIEFVGPKEEVDFQLKHSIIDGVHKPGKVRITVKTVESTTDAKAECDPFNFSKEIYNQELSGRSFGD